MMAGKKHKDDPSRGRPRTKIHRNVNRVLMVVPGSVRFRVDYYAKKQGLERFDAYREILSVGIDSLLTDKEKKQLQSDWDDHVAKVIQTSEDSEYFVKPRGI